MVSGAAWLLLSYGMPLILITGHGAGSALAGISGTWFLWTVGTQSPAVALASLKPPLASPPAPQAPRAGPAIRLSAARPARAVRSAR